MDNAKEKALTTVRIEVVGTGHILSQQEPVLPHLYQTGIVCVNGDVTEWEIENHLNVTKYALHSNLTLKN